MSGSSKSSARPCAMIWLASWISVVGSGVAAPVRVSVNVSELDLRRHNLSFDDVVRAIQSARWCRPGAIKGIDGDIRVQTRGQAYYREDFERIVLLTARDGADLFGRRCHD